MLPSLTVISIQSDNTAFTCREITWYLADQLGMPAEFIDDIPWQEREQRLDTGQAHLGWICGLPYVQKAGQDPAPVELVAAPVMESPRYQQRPIYFSDVIVHRDSRFYNFTDLAGASWAYNEPHSQSGYNVTRYHLARLGKTRGYFGRVIEAGSHLGALEMVLAQQIDAAAIDSTVLELELQSHPQLGAVLRIIETLGPSPAPPWVVSTRVPAALRQAIRRVFWQMHKTPAGQEILARGQLLKMARVADRDYDPIREMARAADPVIW